MNPVICIFNLRPIFPELPPSAAQEPPPTPKTNASTSSTFEPTFTHVTTQVNNCVAVPACCRTPQFPSGAVFSGGAPIVTNSIVTPITTCTIQSTQAAPQCMPSGSHHRGAPSPLSIDVAISSTGGLCDVLDEPLPSLSDLSFINMDWADDTDLPDQLLDLNGSLGGATVRPMDMLAVVQSPCESGSVHGSEPNVSAMTDAELTAADNSHMSMDVSDWLDLIMPSTGLTPLSANAPVCFPSDSVFTPKPQDVLDLFNMDETDLYTPTDMGLGFDKVMEVSSPNT